MACALTAIDASTPRSIILTITNQHQHSLLVTMPMGDESQAPCRYRTWADCKSLLLWTKSESLPSRWMSFPFEVKGRKNQIQKVWVSPRHFSFETKVQLYDNSKEL